MERSSLPAQLPQPILADPGELADHPGEAEMDDDGPGAGDEPMEGSLEVEAGFEDVQEELDYLGPDLHEELRDAAADFLRAVFVLGASPVEAKALVTEIFSPPPEGDGARRPVPSLRRPPRRGL